MIAVSKEMHLRRDNWSVISPEVEFKSGIETAVVNLTGLAALVASGLREFLDLGLQ